MVIRSPTEKINILCLQAVILEIDTVNGNSGRLVRYSSLCRLFAQVQPHNRVQSFCRTFAGLSEKAITFSSRCGFSFKQVYVLRRRSLSSNPARGNMGRFRYCDF